MKKRFITLFAVCLTVVAVASTVFYFLICEGLRHVKRDAVGKFNYLIHDTTYYNTVFIGSSSMHVDINPLQFDSLTGLHSFNGGMDGMQIAEVKMVVWRYIASHGAPQQIFLNIDEQTLGMDGDIWYFPQYYPFMRDSDMADIVAMEPKLLLGKYFPPAAVTFFDDPLKNLALIGLLKERNKKDYEIPLRGFVAKTRKLITDEQPKTQANFVGSERGMQLLEETIDFCLQHGVKTNILLLPRYDHSFSDSSLLVVEKLKSVAAQYGTRVYDFSLDKRFASKDLFYDRIHLNQEGAALFTSILAKEIAPAAQAE